MLITSIMVVPTFGTPRGKLNSDRIFKWEKLWREILVTFDHNIRQKTEDTYSKFLHLKYFKMVKDIAMHHRGVTIELPNQNIT